jgi:hypothetical protein
MNNRGHALTYSLITYLKAQIPEVSGRVTWIYDGVTLAGTTKPFATIEQLTDNNAMINAGRTDFEERYLWQVGVRTNNVNERTKLAEKIRDKLRSANVPLYDTSGTSPALTADTFTVDVGDIVPIPLEDVSNETDKHRAYIDVSVMVYADADGNFSQ